MKSLMTILEEIEKNNKKNDKDELNNYETKKSENPYTADDLREIIDFIYDILEKENKDDKKKKEKDIGLDLIYEYADMIPETVINQMINDLKDMFEIEDTILDVKDREEL